LESVAVRKNADSKYKLRKLKSSRKKRIIKIFHKAGSFLLSILLQAHRDTHTKKRGRWTHLADKFYLKPNTES